MKKLSDSKLPVEVKGNMSPEGSDRVGMLMTVTIGIDRLWWKIAILVGLAALVFNGELVTHVANANKLTPGETAYACLVAYHPPTKWIEFECLRVQGH
ncbi:MAG TPA: hypothetical protein DIW64_12865 [Cellvibrio sp.]|nr:hypothetical protein [Cellvibrio sp.]